MRRTAAALLVSILAVACAGPHVTHPGPSPGPPRAGAARTSLAVGVDRIRKLRDFWIQDLSFVDRSHGWALGYFAEPTPGLVTMQRTDDGGRTWHLTSPPTSEPGRPVTHLRFADPRDGWAYGPALYATHDGGETWARERLGGPVRALQPAGSSVWAVAGGRLWSTPASTDRWRAVRGLPTITGSLVDLVRSGPARGWLLWGSGAGRNPASSHLLGTTDGGTTWTRRAVPCGTYCNEEDVAAAPGTLWLVCGNGPGAGSEEKRLYLSADGGRHWLSRGWAPYNGYTALVAAVSPTSAWFADIGSPLLHSKDGGRTWQTAVSILDNTGWSAVSFPGDLGWVATRDSLYRTSDGGVHWSHRRIAPSGCG